MIKPMNRRNDSASSVSYSNSIRLPSDFDGSLKPAALGLFCPQFVGANVKHESADRNWRDAFRSEFSEA